MKRRGFFAAIAGALAGLVALKVAPAAPSRRVVMAGIDYSKFAAFDSERRAYLLEETWKPLTQGGYFHCRIFERASGERFSISQVVPFCPIVAIPLNPPFRVESIV